MGEPKAMVELASRPLVARVVAHGRLGGLDPVVVAKPDSPLPQARLPGAHRAVASRATR